MSKRCASNDPVTALAPRHFRDFRKAHVAKNALFKALAFTEGIAGPLLRAIE